MYCVSSRGQPTRGGPLARGLGDVLTTPHRKHVTNHFTGSRMLCIPHKMLFE